MGKSTATRRTATHRPATKRRRFRNDDLVAVDLFSGFGGLTRGIEMAGFTTIMAANHNPYKVEVHEANHPHAEHWIADLVDPTAADYHSARDLPARLVGIARAPAHLDDPLPAALHVAEAIGTQLRRRQRAKKGKLRGAGDRRQGSA